MSGLFETNWMLNLGVQRQGFVRADTNLGKECPAGDLCQEFLTQ